VTIAATTTLGHIVAAAIAVILHFVTLFWLIESNRLYNIRIKNKNSIYVFIMKNIILWKILHIVHLIFLIFH
jgi:hypothetical protein